MAGQEDKYQYALSSNQAWAGYKQYQNPQFFKTLAAGQSPQILWLGCSDSRCPETTILGLHPGDVFVHRNIANIISPTDINTSAVIEYSVAHLKVKHVILCGHTSCGGAAAALSDSRVGGVLDTWLAPLKAVRAAHEDELKAIRDDHARAVRIAELNVEAGIKVLLSNWVIREAIRDRGLQVHGCLFDIASGRIRDLGFGSSGLTRGSVNGDDEVVRGKHAMLVFRGGNANMAVK
jgi:carbonic anhydrase